MVERRGGWWLPLVAAGAVVAVAAGVAVVLNTRAGGERQPAAAVPTVPTVPTGPTGPTGPTSPTSRAASGDQVVRDGDRVTGRGQIVALPGRPVQLCAPYATISIYPEPIPGPCRLAVTVTGLDLDRLSNRRERDGAVWGSARVEGVYRAGTLTVTKQLDDRRGPVPDVVTADRVPCPEPPGGWPRQPADPSRLIDALTAAVQANPETYNGPWVRYPYGWHLQDTSDRKGTEVYVVGTTRDREAARAALTRLVPAEHLCVTTVRWSKAAMDAAQQQLTGPEAEAAGISGGRGELLEDRVVADLVVLDERADNYLATVAGGRVVPLPLLRKAG
jgi:hypothetical protein